MSAKLTAVGRLSRLLRRCNERFLWEAMSAGEWGEIRRLPYPLLVPLPPKPPLKRRTVSALIFRVTDCLLLKVRICPSICPCVYFYCIYWSVCLHLWKCVRWCARVCVLHVSGCVFGVIASELPGCQWPFLIYSSIKKLLPALAFLFYVCSSLHEEAPRLLMLFLYFYICRGQSLQCVCEWVWVRGRSVVLICAFQ